MRPLLRQAGTAAATLACPVPAPPSIAATCRQLQHELDEARAELTQVRSLLERTREGERAARHLANHDGLTALPNRRAFLDKLTLALVQNRAQGRDLAVMFIDLDRFKDINDTHGHRVGDQLLAIVGTRLTQAVRAADIAARLGGDEFACLLQHAPSLAHIAQVATKLFDGIAAPIQVGGLSLHVHASIGIAICKDGQTLDAEQLMARADRAMYHAKRQHCRFCFATQEGGVSGV
ncbi:GGDEF domain-containing protein [Hydrogenophaga sp. OTU3427]|uniref:GGDEF domain-containing protein n=1 Tax=Hydrogenophaga sp. OTU3427 TaxID=3043856 RepID=UPI00313AF631